MATAIPGAHVIASSIFVRLKVLKHHTIAKNLVSLLAGTALGQFFLAVATLITARALGSASFGQYAACFALASLTSTAFNFGLDGRLLQQGQRATTDLGGEVLSSFALKLLLGLPWIVVLGLLAPQINANTYPAGLVMIVASTVWTDGLLAIFLSAFKASLRNHLTSFILITSMGTLLVATVLLAGLRLERPEIFAGIRLAISVVALAVAALLLLRDNLPRLRLPFAPLLRAAAPFALSDLFFLVYMKADIAIISMQLDEQAVGLYAPASSLVSALFLVPSALFMIAVPVLSRMLQDIEETDAGSLRARKALFDAILRLMVASAIVGFILMLVVLLSAKSVVLFLLGPAYAPTAQLLEILSVLLLFKAGSFSTAAVLVAADRQGQRVWVQGLVAVANVALSWLMLQMAGVEGVAWAYVCTEAILFLGYGALLNRWWSEMNKRVWSPEGVPGLDTLR